jgi:hypothetical protein
VLPLQALLAIDIANERSREAAELASRHRTAELIAEEAAEHPTRAADVRPGRGRHAAAAILHLVEGGASTVARSARDAASRLDGSGA